MSNYLGCKKTSLLVHKDSPTLVWKSEQAFDTTRTLQGGKSDHPKHPLGLVGGKRGGGG